MVHRLFPQRSIGLARRSGRLCRTAAAVLIAGLSPRRTFGDLESMIEAAPLRDQAVIVCGTLALLLAGAVGAAQFGVVGLLVYWMAVILIAR